MNVAPPLTALPTTEDVASFWEAHPCDSTTASAAERLAYFQEIERVRYTNQSHLPRVADCAQFHGRRVLEIGCGLGTDGVQFAKGGASYTGVDLTQAAVSLSAENFRLRNLAGTFARINAERLPFASASFDHVYSYGVIHHAVHPEAIVDEMYRVLKPGGTFTVMLYNRTSINYYLQIMFLRKLGRMLLQPAGAPALLAKLLGLSRAKLDGHRQNLLRIPRPTPEQWVSMNTDGPDCPLARVYSAAEVHALFTRFRDVRTAAYFFDRSHWPFVGRLLPDAAVEALGRRWGWHRIIIGRK
jgi:2-polyprenyl-3-methyl-5-hydroxy-6-metoxy-1,4-benzoquinol methylase